MQVYEGEVPSAFLEEVEDRVKKMVRRCSRKGMPAPRLTVGKPFMKTDWHEEPCSALDEGAYPMSNGWCRMVERTIEYVPVTIEADPLRISGWALIGVVTPALKDGREVALTTSAPGYNLPQTLTVDDPQRCQHCGKVDRTRKETFLVQHETGDIRQVGRQCLRDFLGYDPATLIAYREWLDDLRLTDEEVRGWNLSAPRYYPVADVIRAAARVVTKVGFYVSRAKAEASGAESDAEYEEWEQAGSPENWSWKHRNRLQSTGSETKWVLDPPTGLKSGERPSDLFPETPEVDVLVEDTLAGLDEMRLKDAKGDWEWSLEQATSVDSVQMRNVGVVASAVILGMRRQEWRAREREAREEAKRLKAEHPQEYIGQVGERLKNVPAEVTFIRPFESQFGYGGTSYLVRMLTERGTLVWWASSIGSTYNPETKQYETTLKVGDKVTVTGTVKRHEEDRYTHLPTTVLTRCKVLDSEGQAI